MAKRRFECTEGTSRKFWEVSVSGNIQTVQFGRIGSGGMAYDKRFPTPAAATANTDKLVAQKLAKGYRQVGKGAVAAPKPAAKGGAKAGAHGAALMEAAKAGDAVALGKLLAAGADPNGADEKGATALMWAARNGQGTAISALLAAGADPNLQMESDATALTIAVRRGHEGAVKQLIAGGTDLSGARGELALQRAADKGNVALVALLGRAGVGDPVLAQQFRETFDFLCDSKKDRELLFALSCLVRAMTRKGKGLEVTLAKQQVSCSPPAKVKALPWVPKSYRAIAEHFNGIDWPSTGGGVVGFPGLGRDGSPLSDYGWDSTYLRDATNPKLEAALKKVRQTFSDLTPAFGCAQNWILFDPTRKTKLGEPALAFVSHESCEWEPVRSADRLSCRGVLLQLLARYFLGTDGLDEVSL